MLRIPTIRLATTVVKVSKEFYHKKITSAALNEENTVLMDAVPVPMTVYPVQVYRKEISRRRSGLSNDFIKRP